MTGADHIIRQQQEEIKSLKGNLRIATKTSEDLRGLIDRLNAEKQELSVALQAACDTFQPALKEVETQLAAARDEIERLRARTEDRIHEC